MVNKMNLDGKKNKIKKRRSIIRLIVSCIPNCLWKYLLPVPRMYINPALIRRDNERYLYNHINDPGNSFNDFRSYFDQSQKKSDLFSTPKPTDKSQAARISFLQRELQELKQQVAKILEHQCEKVHSSDYATLSNQSPENELSQGSSTHRPPPLPSLPLPPTPPPLPPPPPPPPMPQHLLSANIQPGTKNLITKKPLNSNKRNGFSIDTNLLNVLKSDLKKIEKSPGGGPLKKQNRLSRDPSDILEVILRKRFTVLHSDSSDCDSSIVNESRPDSCPL